MVKALVTATMAATDFAPTEPMRLSPVLSDATLVSLLLWMASQVVGQCTAWIARIPTLRAPSGRGHPAMRFVGLAWLAHRGGCPEGCFYTERASSGCNEQQGASDGRICHMRGRSAPWQHMQRAGTQRKAQRAVSHGNGTRIKFAHGETYRILVSEPVTATIAATAFAPTGPT